MKDFIFLLLTGFCIAVEIEAIVRAKAIIFYQTNYAHLDANEKENFYKKNPAIKRFLSLSFLYMLTCLAGLFTSQWYCFLFVLVLSFFPRKKRTVFINNIDSLCCIAAMILAILLNLKIV